MTEDYMDDTVQTVARAEAVGLFGSINDTRFEGSAVTWASNDRQSLLIVYDEFTPIGKIDLDLGRFNNPDNVLIPWTGQGPVDLDSQFEGNILIYIPLFKQISN
jgi:hypothetical protein